MICLLYIHSFSVKNVANHNLGRIINGTFKTMDFLFTVTCDRVNMERRYQCSQCNASFSRPSKLQSHKRIWSHHDSYECDLCHKKFAREDNLKTHRQKHGNNTYYECDVCHKVFCRKDNLDSHKRNLHLQFGRGTKRKLDQNHSKSVKRRITKYDDPEDSYTIRAVEEHNMPKFNTQSMRYKVTFHGLEIRSLQNILRSLKLLFSSILRDITEYMSKDDLVRLSVQSPELDFPITLPFRRLSQLTSETFLSEVERVLQSYEEFVLDESLDVDIIHVRLPSGGVGKRCKYIDLGRMLKEKRGIIRINNSDDLCCARAIVTAMARLDKHPKWERIRHGGKIQTDLAIQLHRKADVPLQRCTIKDLHLFQKVLPDFQLNVLSKDSFNSLVYQGHDAEKKIYLYHHDDHFDVVTKVAGFLSRSYFCTKCNKGYDHKERHFCNNVCRCCHKLHSDMTENWKFCSDCNRSFKNPTCFELHRFKPVKGRSTCETYYKCKQCTRTINRSLHKREHVCGEKYCNTCMDYVDENHQCFMKPDGTEIPCEGEEQYTIEFNKKKQNQDDSDEEDPNVYIFFDFECTQDQVLECSKGHQKSSRDKTCVNCKQSWCGTKKHTPNLCVVQKVCDDCKTRKTDAVSICPSCGTNERIFDGPNTRDDFCKWLFSEENKDAKVICHNFKGYDSYPIMSYLYENGILPEVIMNGSKLMCLDVPKCNIRFLDSINFIPMALDKMPKTFGFTEMAKGYFPHLFNTTENQTVVLEHLPDVQYYHPDGMKPDKRKSFLKWYKEHKNDKFDFQKELLKYCRSDVDILRKCCLRFKELFEEMTTVNGMEGVDPFQRCITIASACQLVFRRHFLEENCIGIIPPHGYKPETKHSVKALQWLKYMSQKLGIKIQHARNGGEKVIGPYKIDGYYERDGEKVVLEFHGDFWHGNPECYSADTYNPVRGLTMGELYQETMDKQQYLQNNGYTYVCEWEKNFDQKVTEDTELREIIATLNLQTPLVPRDAFFGGRTEAFQLFAEADENTSIQYYDVTSLYPFINKTGKIPIGHPDIITENFKSISSYEGLIKCKVLPPKGLFIPVLPTRVNGKLLFGLCKTCMESKQMSTCTHSEADRSIIGTWVTDELKRAIEKGYTVTEIYEVWHFENISQYDPVTKTGGIFTNYVNTFLKVKQEASGWPDWCKSEDDKRKYIHNYYAMEGILLEYDKIKFNPGLRALAKLMLNSFWGKFGQRLNLPRTRYLTEPVKYFDLLTSDEQNVLDVSFVNDEMVRIQWVNNDDFIENTGRTNVIIAAYTTAQARLKLHSYLEKLDRRVLYADTDSIVFTTKPGEWEPELGDYLGDLTNEVPDNEIEVFVTGGPKNYAYTLKKSGIDGKISQCKIRGITLSYANLQKINFETIQEMVQNIDEKDDAKITVTDLHKIARNTKTMNIITKVEEKDYKIVFDKRVLQGKVSIPYGM